MGGLSRMLAVTALSFRTLRSATGASAVAVVGVAGVVLVFVAVLSIAEGFQVALAGAGSPDTAIIMRGGSDSALALADTRIIKGRRGNAAPAAFRSGRRCASSRAASSGPAPTRSSSAGWRLRNSADSSSAPSGAGARASGKWSASSRPTAPWPSPRSGATRACCSRPTAGGDGGV